MNATENISRKKRLIVWLSLVIAFFITLYFKIYPSSISAYFSSGTATKDISNDLFSSLLTLLTFGLIYQIYTEKENRETARKDIIDALQSDNSTLSLLSEITKMNFLKNTVCSIIGEKYGALLYSNLIEKYIIENTSWRENFTYKIAFNKGDEDFSFKGIDKISRDEYFLQEQSLTYTKHFKPGTKDIPFKIVFAFNDRDLDRLMAEKSIFFREIIQVKGIGEAVKDYNAQDFKDLIEKGLNLKLKFCKDDDTTIVDSSNMAGEVYNVSYVNGEVKRIEITLKDAVQKKIHITDNNSIHYTCKMTFKMPFNKKTTKFHLALPEPTLNCSVDLRFDRSIKNIDYFTIFSNSSRKLKFIEEEFNYSLQTTEMIYPRSGALFFWSI